MKIDLTGYSAAARQRGPSEGARNIFCALTGRKMRGRRLARVRKAGAFGAGFARMLGGSVVMQRSKFLSHGLFRGCEAARALRWGAQYLLRPIGRKMRGRRLARVLDAGAFGAVSGADGLKRREAKKAPADSRGFLFWYGGAG